jgi:hypothetical protein
MVRNLLEYGQFNILQEEIMIQIKTVLTLSVCLLVPIPCGAEQYLGFVSNGEFNAVIPKKEKLLLTSVHVQEARSPESGKLKLKKYEGAAILVEGMASGDIVYDARVIEKAGRILTLVVEKLLPNSQ